MSYKQGPNTKTKRTLGRWFSERCGCPRLARGVRDELANINMIGI